MTSSITEVGNAAMSAVLSDLATEITSELHQLKEVFNREVAPRAKRIGQLLSRARGNFPANSQFYDWAETTVFIKQRQVRSYIRFYERSAAIEAAAEEKQVPISSIEQGLALLAPEPTTIEITDTERKLNACAQAVGRAKGAISRAMDSIYDLTPGGLSAEELRAMDAVLAILNRYGEPALAGTIPVVVTTEPELAVDRPPVDDWVEQPAAAAPAAEVVDPLESDNPDTIRLGAVGLPCHLKPSKWTPAQFAEGLAMCDGVQARFAKAIGVSRASISSLCKKYNLNQDPED